MGNILFRRSTKTPTAVEMIELTFVGHLSTCGLINHEIGKLTNQESQFGKEAEANGTSQENQVHCRKGSVSGETTSDVKSEQNLPRVTLQGSQGSLITKTTCYGVRPNVERICPICKIKFEYTLFSFKQHVKGHHYYIVKDSF